MEGSCRWDLSNSADAKTRGQRFSLVRRHSVVLLHVRASVSSTLLLRTSVWAKEGLGQEKAMQFTSIFADASFATPAFDPTVTETHSSLRQNNPEGLRLLPGMVLLWAIRTSIPLVDDRIVQLTDTYRLGPGMWFLFGAS